MAFTLPSLKYDFNSLEPHIDAKTMEIHHDKHHQAYVDKLNEALQGHTDLQEKSIEELLSSINSLPEDIKMAVRNNGGGHWNHTFFWEILTPDKVEPSQKIKDAIAADFGDWDKFVEEFESAGAKRFGSGWVWLIRNSEGKLRIVSTPNQDNPVMELAETKGTPILGVDVWEHAYYLNYQNRRPDYLKAVWNVINWAKVEELYNNAPVEEVTEEA